MESMQRLQHPACPARECSHDYWTVKLPQTLQEGKKKKKKKNAYFTASVLRARNVNFTNKLPSRFCSGEIGALAFLWFLQKGQKTNKLPATEK